MATEKNKVTPGKLMLTALYLLLFPTLILLLSGDWLWIEGWIFNIWFIALCATTIIYLYRHDPVLLLKGIKNQELATNWDGTNMLCTGPSWYLYSGLSSCRSMPKGMDGVQTFHCG